MSTWITPSLSSNINSYAAHSAKPKSPLSWFYSPVGPYQHVSIKAAEKDSWCLRGLECIFLLQCTFQSRYSTWLLLSLRSSPSFLHRKKKFSTIPDHGQIFSGHKPIYFFLLCLFEDTSLYRQLSTIKAHFDSLSIHYYFKMEHKEITNLFKSPVLWNLTAKTEIHIRIFNEI